MTTENEVKKGRDKLELLATRSFTYYDEMYKVVDFVNQNLKEKGVMLGLTKDKITNKLTINIYEF